MSMHVERGKTSTEAGWYSLLGVKLPGASDRWLGTPGCSEGASIHRWEAMPQPGEMKKEEVAMTSHHVVVFK